MVSKFVLFNISFLLVMMHVHRITTVSQRPYPVYQNLYRILSVENISRREWKGFSWDLPSLGGDILERGKGLSSVLWRSHVCKCKAVSQSADTCGRKQVIIRSFWCCDVPVPLPRGEDLATLLLLPPFLKLGRTERWHDSGFTFWCWKH